MIKAVLLDFYGTLAYDTIDFNATWNAYYLFLKSQFNALADYQTYLAALQKTIEWAKYMREIRLHEVTFYQFHSRVLSTLNIPSSRNWINTKQTNIAPSYFRTAGELHVKYSGQFLYIHPNAGRIPP